MKDEIIGTAKTKQKITRLGIEPCIRTIGKQSNHYVNGPI